MTTDRVTSGKRTGPHGNPESTFKTTITTTNDLTLTACDL